MKITVARRDLHPALTTIARIVEARSTLPILTHVLIEAERDADGGRLSLTATDLDMEVRLKIPAKVDEPGATTIHAARLHTIAGKLVDGDIDLETLADNATARLKQGRSRFDLQVLPKVNFPNFGEADYATGFDIAADLIAEAIDATSFAISTEETRYYLNGVFLHVVSGPLGSTLIAVSTDGHRLSKWSRPAPAGAEGMQGVILPRKTVGELSKLCKGSPNPARIEVSDTRLRLTLGEIVLTSKVIDGTFPDYDRVIPKDSAFMITLDRAALAATLDRIQTVLSSRGSAVKFTLRDECLVASAINPDAGSAAEEMAFDGQADIEIGFNARYALDVLNGLTGGRVEVHLTDPGSPAVFRPANPAATAAERLAVIMPMRV